MRNTQLALVLLLLFCLVPDARALGIEVGDRPINLPLPDGFVELTPEMAPYYETMRAYIGPGNLRYVTLITSDNGAALLRGENVDLKRYINVESEEAISAASISAQQFSELRDVLRQQIGEIYADIEKRLPDLVDDGNRKVSKDLNADLAVELGGLVPLPIHLDTDHAIANAMFMTVGGTVDGAEMAANVLSATTLFLHVKDKVVFLYVYGTESDLEWTKETAGRWATEILAANPLSAVEQRAIEEPSSPGINWSKVFENAWIAALIGAAIALFAYMLGKR